VLSRSTRSFTSLLLTLPCVACGAQDLWGETDALFGVPEGQAKATSGLAPTVASCPAASVTEPPATGTPLWLYGYDERAITGLASDSRGNLLVARAGETLKASCAGDPIWSQPFGERVAVDEQDNVYVAGGSTNGSAFVTKLDGDGNIVYSVELSGGATVESVAVDGSQNVAVSGTGLGTAKLDRDGNVVWQRSFLGQLAFDSQSHLWLTGSLVGALDLGDTVLTSQGGSDVLLLQLAGDGAVLLARAFGDAGSEQRGESLAVDGADSVYLGGTFDGSVDFGTGSMTQRPEQCSSDAWCLTNGFVAKLDLHGTALWSEALGPTRSVPGLATTPTGNLWMSNVMPGGVRPFRQPRLQELSGEGEVLWQRSEWPGTGIGGGGSVTVDATGHVIWALSARPSLEQEEQAYLAKLAP